MGKDRQGDVKAAGRTLDLFEIFARQLAPLSLSELAQLMDIPVSSTHALVKTLRARGFLYVLENRKRIYPTRRMQVLANQIAGMDPVVEILAPTLQALQEASGETLMLGKRQGDMVIYLDVVESRSAIRYSPQPGERKPLHSSAIGKAMLSLETDEAIRQTLETVGQPRITANTLTDPAALIADIRQGREQGVFITRGENVVDLMGMATLVRLGEESVGIAIGGPLSRMMEKERTCRELLAAARQDIAAMEAAPI
ncbi:MAG: IclR family transcriptional regulator [Roseovarius sp.]|nr:IclR family transcriptional regulator [Roseovarius sp.]